MSNRDPSNSEPSVPGYACRACGEHHDEMPLCFIAPMPFAVAGIAQAEWPARVDLTSDQCVLDEEHFFVLGNLDIPIVGHAEVVRFSVWSTLSEKNFLRASELWHASGRESEPPYFGWLSNQIPGYPRSLSLQVAVHTQEVGVRPLIVFAEQDHDLYREQSAGVTWDRACALSRASL